MQDLNGIIEASENKLLKKASAFHWYTLTERTTSMRITTQPNITSFDLLVFVGAVNAQAPAEPDDFLSVITWSRLLAVEFRVLTSYMTTRTLHVFVSKLILKFNATSLIIISMQTWICV